MAWAIDSGFEVEDVVQQDEFSLDVLVYTGQVWLSFDTS